MENIRIPKLPEFTNSINVISFNLCDELIPTEGHPTSHKQRCDW